jgi:putative ABC transport system permease protein
MLKLGLRTVLSHRLRFLLCTVAVILGVAFVAGSLIFADTLSAAIRRNFAVATADIVVTPVSALDTGAAGTGQNLGDTNGRPATLTSDLATRIEALPDVAATDPHLLLGGVQLLDKSGKAVETYGVPTFGASWPRHEETATFRLVDGIAPWGPDQVALDQQTARRVGYTLGDQLKVVTPEGTITANLTGIISPGLSGVAAGAPLVAFDAATAQRYLLGEPGWTSIGIAVKPGQDVSKVIGEIEQLGSSEIKVQTAAQVTAAGESAVNEAFGGLSAVLLMFAALALFVSTFLIVNTFSMLVAQRARELALLRAVGASRGQVTRTVLTEAVVIGAVGSTLGLLFGAGVAALLQVAFRRLELDVPTAPLQVGAGTIITGYVVGIGVTCFSALPAAGGRGPGAPGPRAAPDRCRRSRRCGTTSACRSGRSGSGSGSASR